MSPPEHPWQRDAAEVVAELDTDLGAGLTAAEAARRLRRYGRNELEAEKPLPAWRRFLGQFADPLIYLLIAAAVVAIAAWAFEGAEGVPFDAIVILAIIVLNAILGYVQEARAEEAVSRCSGWPRRRPVCGGTASRSASRPPSSCPATSCCWPKATR